MSHTEFPSEPKPRLLKCTTISRIRLTLLMLTVAFLAGCELYEQDDYVEQFMVESYLIALEPLPPIRLSTTAPFNENYYFDERAVRDAQIRIYEYDDDDQHTSTIEYIEQRRGVYIPAGSDTTHPVQPLHRYRVEIDAPLHNGDFHRIEAETIVPDTFSVQEVIRDRAVYQSRRQLELRISVNRTGNRQNYYMFSTEAHEPEVKNLTPFWKDAIEDDEDIDAAVRIRTTIVNEENFIKNPDGTINLRLPWIGIAFFGGNTISTFSLDDNTYDFFRSQPAQAGGGAGTISPGEIQNIIYHIDGGIGLFGSMSMINSDVMVERP